MKKCSHNHPGPMDKLRLMLGLRRDNHQWIKSKRRHKQIIFTTRECECGVMQIHHKNGKWVDATEPWRFEWERKWFESAICIE